MDETQDHRAVVQRYIFDDKDIETDAAEGGFIHQTVFHTSSGRKAGNNNKTQSINYYWVYKRKLLLCTVFSIYIQGQCGSKIGSCLKRHHFKDG